MKINALHYIVAQMFKKFVLVSILGLSLNSQAFDFGSLPSSTFGEKGSLSCLSKDACTVPSYESIHNSAETFLSHSPSRLDVLDSMEAEIRAAEQVYDQLIENVFSLTGNTPFKSFLLKGKGLYTSFLDTLGLSAARKLVGGASPFLLELQELMVLLKNAEADIINAKSKEQIEAQKRKRENSYFNFRNSNKFSSYSYLDQVKKLTEFYHEHKSLAPWFKGTEKSVRINFVSCPLKVRRQIRKLQPTVSFHKDSSPFKFDVLEEPEITESVVQNGQFLNINCVKLVKGALKAKFDKSSNTLTLDFAISNKSQVILPRF